MGRGVTAGGIQQRPALNTTDGLSRLSQLLRSCAMTNRPIGRHRYYAILLVSNINPLSWCNGNIGACHLEIQTRITAPAPSSILGERASFCGLWGLWEVMRPLRQTSRPVHFFWLPNFRAQLHGAF